MEDRALNYIRTSSDSYWRDEIVSRVRSIPPKWILGFLILLFLALLIFVGFVREPFESRAFDPDEYISQLKVSLEPKSLEIMTVSEELSVSLTGQKKRKGIRRSYITTIPSHTKGESTISYKFEPVTAAVISSDGVQQISIVGENVRKGYLSFSLPISTEAESAAVGQYTFPIRINVHGAIYDFETLTVLEWPLIHRIGTPVREVETEILLPDLVPLSEVQARVFVSRGDQSEVVALRNADTEQRGESFSLLKVRTEPQRLRLVSHRPIDPQEIVSVQVAWPRGYLR